MFVGWNKEYNPVLASPKVVTKIDEPPVDVALSVSLKVHPHHVHLPTRDDRTRPWYALARLGL